MSNNKASKKEGREGPTTILGDILYPPVKKKIYFKKYIKYILESYSYRTL